MYTQYNSSYSKKFQDIDKRKETQTKYTKKKQCCNLI